MKVEAVLLAAALAGLASCRQAAPERRFAEIFRSPCSLEIHDRPSEEAFDEVWARLREIDAEMNMWDPESALSRLSASAGSGPAPASADLRAVLSHALRLRELSGGRYDPTVGPLVKLWGVGTPRARVPGAAEIAGALALVGAPVAVDDAAGKVDLPRPGTVLDFGSVAKGYGAVEAERILSARGVRSAVADLGGCVLALGSRPTGEAWRIGVQDPSGPRGARTVGYLVARDAAVATSGTYERRFEEGGKAYHHLMDTATGRPIDNGLVSVTVMVDRRSNPDGPPLALLALGLERGLALADELGLPAVFLDGNRRIRLSKAAEADFVKTNPDYELGGPAGGM